MKNTLRLFILCISLPLIIALMFSSCSRDHDRGYKFYQPVVKQTTLAQILEEENDKWEWNDESWEFHSSGIAKEGYSNPEAEILLDRFLDDLKQIMKNAVLDGLELPAGNNNYDDYGLELMIENESDTNAKLMRVSTSPAEKLSSNDEYLSYFFIQSSDSTRCYFIFQIQTKDNQEHNARRYIFYTEDSEKVQEIFTLIDNCMTDYQ